MTSGQRLPGDFEYLVHHSDHKPTPNATNQRQQFDHAPASRWEVLADGLYALQPERLIRFARFISSAFALLAIYLDPILPAHNVNETYALLLAYVAYSAFLAVAPSGEALNSRAHFVTHAIDIGILGLLAISSAELSSPFLSFFSFALIVSAIRWGLRGAILTAVLLSVLILMVGWPYDDPDKSDLNELIMRSAYALVAAAMLGYFASHRDRGRHRLAQLAAWPIETVDNGGEPWLERSLRHASEVLGGLSLLVAWSDSEEPRGRIAYWDGCKCIFEDIPDEECNRILSSGQAQACFHTGSLIAAIGLSSALAQHIRHDRAYIKGNKPPCCSAPFSTLRFEGRVFVMDPGYPNEDMISLTEIVAERIAFELEQFAMMRELASAAGWRERGRLARDLHDSVLQDLTAAGLQIRLASGKAPEELREMLGVASSVLQEQQRRIRRFVERARPPGGGSLQALRGQLEAIAGPLHRQWNCAVKIEVAPPDLMVPPGLSAEICQMISEATANAARHGDAQTIKIRACQIESNLEITISDDGKGMNGSASASATWPQSISERVSDLGGKFGLDASHPGLTMRIELAL